MVGRRPIKRLGLAVQLDARIGQRRWPYGGPRDASGHQGDPGILAKLLKLLPGLEATLGLCAMLPGADAPEQLTLDDHRFLNRDKGIWHGVTAVAPKVSAMMRVMGS